MVLMNSDKKLPAMIKVATQQSIKGKTIEEAKDHLYTRLKENMSVALNNKI